jgi:hypothetical protein
MKLRNAHTRRFELSYCILCQGIWESPKKHPGPESRLSTNQNHSFRKFKKRVYSTVRHRCSDGAAALPLPGVPAVGYSFIPSLSVSHVHL